MLATAALNAPLAASAELGLKCKQEN